MDKPQPHYHISDITWRRIQPHLPGQKGQWGGIARDNRLFIDAVLWVLRTGAPWRKLPEEYGKWGTVHHRFIRWRDKRLWEKLLEILSTTRTSRGSSSTPAPAGSIAAALFFSLLPGR